MAGYVLSIVVPAFNEAATVVAALQGVCAVSLPDGGTKEVIVVDDGSTDATAALVEGFLATPAGAGVQLLRHERNRGKGAAVRTAIARARGDYLLVQDADLEYDPREIPLLLDPVLAGRADVVYGSRFVGEKPHRVLFFWHSIGNRLLTTFSNLCTNLNLTDVEVCYKLARADIWKRLTLVEDRFGFEPEVTAKFSRFPGVRIYEVGVSYHGRTYAEGKKIGWRDGVRALWCILKYNVFAR